MHWVTDPVDDFRLARGDIGLGHLAGVFAGPEQALAILAQGDVVNAEREWQGNDPFHETGLQIELTDGIGALVIDVHVLAVRRPVLVAGRGATERVLVQVNPAIDVPIGAETG